MSSPSILPVTHPRLRRWNRKAGCCRSGAFYSATASRDVEPADAGEKEGLLSGPWLRRSRTHDSGSSFAASAAAHGRRPSSARGMLRLPPPGSARLCEGKAAGRSSSSSGRGAGWSQGFQAALGTQENAAGARDGRFPIRGAAGFAGHARYFTLPNCRPHLCRWGRHHSTF